MRRLVTIDLTDADVPLFEAYEAAVLPLLPKHGARLDARVRSLDGTKETHLLSFPDDAAYQAYLADPARLAVRSQWELSGAKADGVEVVDVPT
jgi:hypothetical protein